MTRIAVGAGSTGVAIVGGARAGVGIGVSAGVGVHFILYWHTDIVRFLASWPASFELCWYFLVWRYLKILQL